MAKDQFVSQIADIERVPKEILDKLGHIAEYNGRTKNKELEQMIKARITAFEQKHGEISIEKED